LKGKLKGDGKLVVAHRLAWVVAGKKISDREFQELSEG
jgi:hypothetical protein